MNKFLYIGILLSLAFFSCRKVIDLKLKDSEPQFVLKGEVNAGDSVHVVSITKSVSFNASNVFPGVTGANVILSDNIGNSETLTDLGNGKYTTVNFMAVPGRTYTLTVTAEGTTFVSVSTIPQTVPLTDVEFLPTSFFGDTGFILVPKFVDPFGVKNFYRFNFFNPDNEEEDAGFVISDDGFSDGQENQQPFFGSWTPQSGDTVVYRMWGIDENVFKYYFSFDQNTNGNSGAPANPVSNWSNNALGYFTAQNFQSIVVVAPN